MNRRRFLQALGMLGAAPAISPPMMAFAGVPVAVPTGTLRWAEVIVRAHKTCSPAMLQRTLGVAPAVAEAVQSKLIANGVLGAQPNSWGLYKATNPLFDGVFRQADIVTHKAPDLTRKFAEGVRDRGEEEILPQEQPVDDEPFEITAGMLYDEAQWAEGQRIIAQAA